MTPRDRALTYITDVLEHHADDRLVIGEAGTRFDEPDSAYIDFTFEIGETPHLFRLTAASIEDHT